MWDNGSVVVLQNKSWLKPENQEVMSAIVFFTAFFFFVYSPPASVVHAALWGAVVSERFFSVLNLSISLCPGKKYIRMKLEKPTGAKLCEKMMSFFPAFCKNKKKKK